MRYRYFVADTKVICVSSYAGKPVRGIAKCDPKDEFNLETGKGLARLRCDVKIAEKRARRSLERSAEASVLLEKAMAYQKRMRDYALESHQELDAIKKQLAEFESKV